ncbi:hypothetical protein NP233_g8600 [Leucocoprinus birnbaumii]|uniref:Uncharacterized protein n=1 Tax=Leucocoprinus birnbaumii TaxID=56174 RepID=A0AAD5VPG8_9AGAR|nr:hypothetical protein NP233_g8600 [Leucocoprinus birnbaumii]
MNLYPPPAPASTDGYLPSATHRNAPVLEGRSWIVLPHSPIETTQGNVINYLDQRFAPPWASSEAGWGPFASGAWQDASISGFLNHPIATSTKTITATTSSTSSHTPSQISTEPSSSILPGSSTTSNPLSTTSAITASSGGHINTTLIIILPICATIFVLLIISALLFLRHRRRKLAQAVGDSEATVRPFSGALHTQWYLQLRNSGTRPWNQDLAR